MPVIASATLEVTPVLSGAQQSITEQLTGEVSKASEAAGKEGGSKLSSGLVKGVAGGAALMAGAVAGAGAAMVNAAGATAEYGDQIDKASQKLGVSSTFYQEWEAVLQHSGTSMDSMSASFKKLANASQDASKDQVAAFEAIGLSMDQVAGMSTEDLFKNVVSGLQGMEEGTERTAIATQLLGKGAMQMGALFNTSSEDTQGMIDKVHELGGVMGEDAVKSAAAYQDSLQDMQTALSGVKNGLMADLLPVMADFMTGIGDFIGNTDLTPITDTLSKAVSALGQFINSLDITSIGNTFTTVIGVISDVIGTAWDVISEVFGALSEGFTTITASLGDTGTSWEDVWGGISEVIESVAEVVATAVGVIAEAIAWVVGEAQTEGTLFNTIWTSMSTAVSGLVSVVRGVVSVVNALMKGDFKGAWEAAKNVVRTALTSVRTICSTIWNGIKSTAVSIWNGIRDAMAKPIETAKSTISGILDTIKGFFPISIGNIFSNLKLPHFSLSGSFSLNPPSVPHLSVDWYAKAMEQPYMFNTPSLIGVGEAGDEMLYGKQALMRDIRDAMGGGGDTYINITVNGAENPEEFADRMVRELQLKLRTA